jgi:hypothetical protein
MIDYSIIKSRKGRSSSPRAEPQHQAQCQPHAPDTPSQKPTSGAFTSDENISKGKVMQWSEIVIIILMKIIMITSDEISLILFFHHFFHMM